MLALCARYQLRPVGLAPNSSHSRTACDDGSPANPSSSATVSHPSSSSRSLTARHHTLPGGDASRGLSTPRRACQRMNDNAARRNGRCRGAWPVGPWNTRAISARRAAGSSRTAATCAPAKASAPASWLIASSDSDSPKTNATSARDCRSWATRTPGVASLSPCATSGVHRWASEPERWADLDHWRAAGVDGVDARRPWRDNRCPPRRRASVRRPRARLTGFGRGPHRAKSSGERKGPDGDQDQASSVASSQGPGADARSHPAEATARAAAAATSALHGKGKRRRRDLGGRNVARAWGRSCARAVRV